MSSRIIFPTRYTPDEFIQKLLEKASPIIPWDEIISERSWMFDD